MSNKCTVPNCDYVVFKSDTANTNLYCVFHTNLKEAACRGTHCIKSNCRNVKRNNNSGYCKKHYNNPKQCCIFRCKNNDLSNYPFCIEHMNTIITCKIPVCKREVDSSSGYCLKHRVDTSYCCEPSCFKKNEHIVPFCMEHFKSTGNLCRSDWCFTRLDSKTDYFCVRHLANITYCLKRACFADSYKDGLCTEHCFLARKHADSVVEDASSLKRKLHDISLDTDMDENIADFINLSDFDLSTDYLQDLVYDWDLGNNSMDFTNVFL